MDLTLVPAAAANLPNGKVLLWSASSRLHYKRPGLGFTYTSVFDPATGTATERVVSETAHDMFCPGTTNLPDGSVLVSGGSDAALTSIYQPANDTWAVAAQMTIPRAYQANTLLQDGSVFTLGGSWAGPLGNKHGEVWTAGGGWRRLSGVPVDPALPSYDPEGVYRSDNHMWLFPAPDGRVLQAGPGENMNWIDTRGTGSITPAGTRGKGADADPYSQSGVAVMYDIGKILKTGGAPAYEKVPATANTYIIDVNAGVSVTRVPSMTYPRAFANGVVLPNGQVVIIGGQTTGVIFSDDYAVLATELWDPATRRFYTLPPVAVGRAYHSIALLLPDGRVLSGGGGLCGPTCAVNRTDVQILTPHYLLNSDGSPATRPVITGAPAQATHGREIQVATDSAVSSFALVRMSSNTHSVNNDQRRIPLKATFDSGTRRYRMTIPANPGITLPGYYMLFALNSRGVPSVSVPIRITGDAAPRLASPGPQSAVVGSSVALALTASSPNGAVSFSATGLPFGLTINTSTGLVSGTPLIAGTFNSVVSASDSFTTTSTNVLWTIQPSPNAPVDPPEGGA
jgi:hypothetical protein